MNLPTEIFGDVVVVHTPEEFGADQSNGVEQFLTTVERNNVVLDMDNTEMIDSEGLTAIVESQKNLRELSGDLKISTTNHVNRKILEITRLDQQLVRSRAEADRIVGEAERGTRSFAVVPYQGQYGTRRRRISLSTHPRVDKDIP